MLYGEDRIAHREIFYKVWDKYQNKALLEPLEKQLLAIILQHPEYHYVFSDKEKYLDKDFKPELGEVNPFFHFALHQSVRDQVRLDKPRGINKLHKKMVRTWGEHDAEHCIMNSLAFALYNIQSHGGSFDEKAYLRDLKKNLRDGYWGEDSGQ